MGTRPRSLEERLFSAAVLRRSFELNGEEHQKGFRFVYEGVLRDLKLQDAEVAAYLEEHRDAIEAALGRKAGR
jgi:hypothetical protein